MGVLSFGAEVSIYNMPQRKLVRKRLRSPALIVGFLLLFLLLLCSEVLVIVTAGTAIGLVSRVYHRAILSQHHSSGDGADPIAQAEPGR